VSVVQATQPYSIAAQIPFFFFTQRNLSLMSGIKEKLRTEAIKAELDAH